MLETNSRTPFSAEPGRTVPPLSATERKTDTLRSSPDIEPIENMSLSSSNDTPMTGTAPPPAISLSAPGAVQQPKVQTAFIHKLYNMLEDTNIQHLISWSPSNESFVVSPTGEFSKVLSQYFKHTNISSFVRQLNMYGFHKVNDVFHTGSPDATLWEFKHGNGSFKRGDLMGLREIKRRASRHALIHRDSFSGGKGSAASAPGTPNEHPPDSNDTRITNIEHSLYDLSNRLQRTEETNAYLSQRYNGAIEALSRCHQWTLDISTFLSTMCPHESQVFRDIQSLQKEIERHAQLLHEPPEPDRSTAMDISGPPLSPRQRPLDDDSRRSSVSAPRPSFFRPPAPPPPANPQKRFPFPNSSANSSSSSSNSLRPNHTPHPLSHSQFPQNNLIRRHTAADIRQPGWQTTSPFSAFGNHHNNHHQHSNHNHWPPSPSKLSTSSGVPEFREPNYDAPSTRPPIFSARTTPPGEYSNSGSSSRNNGNNNSGLFSSSGTSGNTFTTLPTLNEPSPSNPPSSNTGTIGTGWNTSYSHHHLSGNNGSHHLSNHHLSSTHSNTAPPTRRSSLANSSVHALLNPPTDIGMEGGDGGDADMGEAEAEGERKRKRVG
ncbi:hypothetical protein EX30DRAFT_366711 [Ascodesmis nigricans]|uniref:HSF-type DNA-binding domain-containing protein n=1 Tax=Ascodesmis nigricans TaxID=341454 RepID=A0A4V3SHU3_9PEZI|nr:hypothetical protein EX30DRAFT_366711 [Ascodesmis nigricans]